MMHSPINISQLIVRINSLILLEFSKFITNCLSVIVTNSTRKVVRVFLPQQSQDS